MAPSGQATLLVYVCGVASGQGGGVVGGWGGVGCCHPLLDYSQRMVGSFDGLRRQTGPGAVPVDEMATQTQSGIPESAVQHRDFRLV